MRICKYCNKPIEKGLQIWNPDNDGNGYHSKCLIEMEFNARDRQIYDMGKMDALSKIRAEIEQTADEEQEHDKKWALGLRYAVKIIDKYAACGG